ncbi:MAG: N-6 DNA methylase [Salinivirgaceae bacterium]|nr:N-6 DNA methylase [Salinivirgaceae bacterium]
MFQNTVLASYLKLQDSEVIEKAFKKFVKYFHNSDRQKNIKDNKEEQFQEGFLRELFVNVLGYTLNPEPDFNLTSELKNEKNAKKTDGAILKDGNALAVIELKSTKTKDLESIRQQAFDYKANQTGCVYVITSNFEKIRFYINDAVEFEEFNLFTLNKQQFALMYLCLQKDNLLSNIPLRIKSESLVQEEKITKAFYADYSLFKRELFRDLVKENMKNEVFRSELQKEDIDRANKNIKQALFKKSQKLIDRFLFIFFAEDRGLLPANSTLQILQDWDKLKDLDEDVPLYKRFKLYFRYLDEGRKGIDKKAEIFAYNGGLFKPDAILDSLILDDKLLYKHTKKLSDYDFDSQVDVNILGHIFENSLNEIESINAEIEGADFDKQKTKRKKDGVFYTPKYITKYIVDNTVGKLCAEKKAELNIVEEEFTSNRNKATKKKLLEALETYREWLLQLTICDPACGSGAFLNQALDFLIKEHHYIDELQTTLLGGGMVIPNIETTILEKNIFGVDLNEESIEIAKLSLWLRTAQPRRKLNVLSSNIKCGNSLIDDKKVAGSKAFNWQQEFPNIFTKKDKKVWHITTATHNSRYSQRMFDNHVLVGDAEWFDKEDEIIITETVKDIAIEDKLNIVAYNICGDHMHMLLVCEEDEMTKIVGKIKSVSAKIRNRQRGYTTPENSGNAATTRGHAPLSSSRGKTQRQVWTQKFGKAEIKDDEYLANAIAYINKNREKHELPRVIEIENIKKAFICTETQAFRAEYNGGFDVVVGNPPYVRAELLGFCRDYLESNYIVFNAAGDLFSYFYEQSFKILKENTGLFGFISNTFDKTTAGISVREYLQNEVVFLKYIDFTEVQIFEGATTYPVIITAINKKPLNTSFDYIKIPKSSMASVIDINTHIAVQVEQSSLVNESWSFKSKLGVKLVEKLTKNNNIREIYGKSYRGLLTGLNEAFIIPKSYEVGEHVNPIFEGKELSKWTSSESVQQLILFQSKWTKDELGNDISEEAALPLLTGKYSELFQHILPLEERAKKRYDKGDFFWELRNCAYYDLFEKPKIVFPNLQNNNKFSFDETGAFINAPAVILPTNDKSLLAILNSKLIWYFLINICVVRSGGYIEVKPQYFEQIPIPNISDDIKNELILLTNQIIEETSAAQKLASNFIKLLKSKFEGVNITKKLSKWFDLSFIELQKELSKQKIKMTLSEESEWLDFFEEQTKSYLEHTSLIRSYEGQIDQNGL